MLTICVNVSRIERVKLVYDKRGAHRWVLLEEGMLPEATDVLRLRLVRSQDIQAGASQEVVGIPCPQQVAEHLELLDSRGDLANFQQLQDREIYCCGTRWGAEMCDETGSRRTQVLVPVVAFRDDAWQVGWKPVDTIVPGALLAYCNTPA